MYAGARFANEMKVSTFFLAHFKFDSVPSLALFILSQFLFLFSSLFYFPPSNSRLANDIASQLNLEENPPSRPPKKNRRNCRSERGFTF